MTVRVCGFPFTTPCKVIADWCFNIFAEFGAVAAMVHTPSNGCPRAAFILFCSPEHAHLALRLLRTIPHPFKCELAHKNLVLPRELRQSANLLPYVAVPATPDAHDARFAAPFVTGPSSSAAALGGSCTAQRTPDADEEMLLGELPYACQQTFAHLDL
ncbi:hypothetical protein GPECTOR_43g940 [Gonium pectorale]|uniref:RRM domain-containing protein n=1 Tax=Gonium pectorale TaxID=33097 RepID=A0A150G9R0_GONPE|nr:hypothetical protein GPECTOR_43g940 [Gonium pectorale]|eukprot:KXZ46503.1 hypothetical protein GPECTOR_43g940 [Gonium pectorale]